MKIFSTLTGATTHEGKIIQTDLQKLLFYVDRANASTSPIKLTIDINENGRIRNIAKQVPLAQLMEFAQTKEGFMRKTTGATRTISTGCVDISEGGALALNQNRHIVLTIEGAQTTDIFDIYAVNSGNPAAGVYNYEYGQVGTGVTRSSISTLGTEYIMLEKGQLTEVTQQYSTGRSSKMDVTELGILTDDMSDIVEVELDTVTPATNVAYGSKNYFILDTNEESADTANLEVVLSGTAAFNYCNISLEKI